MVNTGSKADNLYKLKNAGFHVPLFIVVPLNLGPDALLDRLKASGLINHKWFAVRSSSVGEDQKNLSNAGKYHSEIGLTLAQVYPAYKKVIHSYQGTDGSVIVQSFIPSHSAGVLFTNNGHNQCIINALPGLCKPVVEGAPCDEWIFNARGKLVQNHLVPEKECLFHKNGQLSAEKTKQAALSAGQLKRLLKLAHKIEALYNEPQDVEWGFYKDQLIVFQSRPVTRKLPVYKALHYYDSANIAESYSGLVLPLTLSFAVKSYQQVYFNLIHHSGVSKSKLKKYSWVFENMLQSFYGRLYYQMDNWYRMTAFLPGYKRNKQNLEQMITSNIQSTIERDILPGIGLRVLYVLIVLKKLLFFNRIQRKFRNNTQRFFNIYRKLDLNELDTKACQNLFNEISNRLIDSWYIPVENDFMVMTFFGLLKKRFNQEQLSRLIHFKSKTTAQLDALKVLAKKIDAQETMHQLLEVNNFETLHESVHTNKELNALIADYFNEFGGRFANELKLESSDIEEDYTKFYQLLKFYRAKPESTTSPKNGNEKLGKWDAWLLKKFRKYASQREEMRLLRSNGFSLVRRIFNRMAQIYVSQQRLQSASDIYYLKLDEVFNTELNFLERVQSRKKAYESYKKVNPPAFFSIAPDEMPRLSEPSISPENSWNGRGCASGKIRGRVRVMKQYEMPACIDFDILVTYHTDPGWTPLLGLIKGLVVEHGGVLSHAAIVARELGIPSVIGIPGIVENLKTGQLVSMDGDSGFVEVINS